MNVKLGDEANTITPTTIAILMNHEALPTTIHASTPPLCFPFLAHPIVIIASEVSVTAIPVHLSILILVEDLLIPMRSIHYRLEKLDIRKLASFVLGPEGA
jgi:hypothetical protein